MTLPGYDVSSWQASTPNLKGQSFLIARATYGTRPDTMYTAHMRATRKAGLVAGAYAFGTGASSGATQAAAFLAAAGTADLYVLDLESNGGKTPMSRAAAREFIAVVKAAGHKVGLYASESGYPSLGQDFAWVANWSQVPAIPFAFHQYRGSPLDLDHYNGDLPALRKLAGKAAPVVVTYHLRFTGGAFFTYTTDGKPFTDSRGVHYGGTIQGRKAQSFGAPTGAYSGPAVPFAWSNGTRYLARVKGGPLNGQLVATHQSTVVYEVLS